MVGAFVVVVVIDEADVHDSQASQGASGVHVVQLSQAGTGAFQGWVSEPRRSPSQYLQPASVTANSPNAVRTSIFLMILFSYPFLPLSYGSRPDNSTPRPVMCKLNLSTFWNISSPRG